MKRTLSYAEMGLSAVSIILWLLLPVFSFVIIVPLFNISGLNLSIHINQIMLISLAIGIMMVAAAAINNRMMMIVAGLLQAVFIVITIVLRKDILLNGNLRWIYTSAQLLLDAVPNLEISGVQITSEKLREVIALVVNNYMQMGLGFILHAVCTLAYILLACMAPSETRSSFSGTTGGTGSSGTTATFTPNSRTGYKHRT